MVLRVPIGGYLTGGAIWHSQCGESIFAHIPGLIVVMPSRAPDAVGLLRTAFAADDPVLFLEHKHLLRQPYTRDPVPVAGLPDPVRPGPWCGPGADLTIVTYGATVEKSRQAAAALAADDGARSRSSTCARSCPGTTTWWPSPWPGPAGCLVVHEDTYTCGFGAEVAAWIGEHCFSDLDAPVRRVAATDTPRGLRAGPGAGHPAPGRRHPGRRLATLEY